MDSNYKTITFDLPKNQSNVIKVIGIGGGGSNAINHMFQQGIKGVDFYVCNTDAQALQSSPVPNKIQLGVSLTEGLGAGANPDVGEQSAVESYDDIHQILNTNTKMVFITAGMGGGTGTGAAPIIAKMAKDLDILTVAIVTSPFHFEGRMRKEQSQKGIERLRDVVDSLIVINNNKLRDVYGNLGFKAGFSKADEVLSTAARGIAEVITHHYTQNIDLRDAKTVLSDSGTAIMGSALSSGQDRAKDAVSKALDSPLLNDNKITGAKNVLLLIVSGTQEITIDEIGEINDYIQIESGHRDTNIIMGIGEDESLEESISVTIIATGFDRDQQDEINNIESKKVIHALGDSISQSLHIPKQDETISLEKTSNIDTIPPVIHHLEECIEDSIEMIQEEALESKSKESMPKEKPNVVVSDSQDVDDDFEITTISKSSDNIEMDNLEESKQITLTFDLPIAKKPVIEHKEEEEKPHYFSLEEEHAKEESHSVCSDQNNDGYIRYQLDDISEEKTPEITTKNEDLNNNFDQDIFFEKKTVPDTDIKNESSLVSEHEDQDVDPMHLPISDMLKERAEERRRKMKDFNHRFNISKIEDIEKTPAYKRQGVDLEDRVSSDSKLSRTTIVDHNDDIQLKQNNSFLHDNVD